MQDDFKSTFYTIENQPFLETADQNDIHENFFLTKKANGAFLHIEEHLLNEIYAAYDKFKQDNPEAKDPSFKMNANYENGEVYDVYAYFSNTDGTIADERERPHISQQKIENFFKPFETAVSKCFKDGSFILEFENQQYQTNVTDWHTDEHYGDHDNEVIVGILPLEKPHLTTEFPDGENVKKAPEGTIPFVNNHCRHKAPEEQRPTLQAYSL